MRKLLVGMGITGLETARFLLREGEPFDCYDDQKSAAELQQELGTHQITLYDKAEQLDLADYELLIVSPGLRQDHPLLQGARTEGLEILAGVEYAYRQQNGIIVAITGSNGKSTTASLIHHLLEEAGRRTSLCGNIGVPLIACVDREPEHIYVLELSSFQLENVKRFRPQVGLLLNLTPDHLDWHGSLEAYQSAKLRLFAQQQPDDLALVPPAYLGKVPGQGRQRAVPSARIREEDGNLQVGATYQVASCQLGLLGKHNRENALYACAVAEHLGLSAQQVAASLATFRGLEHRMERVGSYQGRLWINDSKATNLHAAQAAVDAIEQPFVLIMGGNDKGERFSTLRLDRNKLKALVVYGETAPIIMKDLSHYQPVHEHDFKDATHRAHQLAGEGDAVLLAPACASFDQFKNFTKRGTVFKELFSEMVAEQQ